MASAMCGADEDKADQGYDAILDRDGDVGRVNMRIPFQLGLSVALDVLSDFIFFSVNLATLAPADSTDSASKPERNLDAAARDALTIVRFSTFQD